MRQVLRLKQSSRLRNMRRTVAVGGLLTTVFTANAPTASGIEAVSVKPYVDLHVDLPYQYNYKNAPFLYGTGQFSAAEAQRGGLAAVVLPLFVPFNVSDHGPRVIDYEQSWQQVKRALDTQKVYAHPGVEPAEGQVRTFYSFEGMGPLGQDLRSLELWVHRGVRLFGLVHNQHNDLAASALDFHGEDFGLTALGQNVVARVYELGGIVDISHASDRTARDVVRIALSLRRPVVATHSNARRLLDHRRNLPDELIDDVAKTGGIIGVNFHSAFLVAGRRATLSDVIRHILYIAGRVGAEHVAIGSDFEGGIRPPRGLETLGQVQHLVPALRAAGLTEDEVQGIMGANALRVLFSRKTGPENKAP